MEIFVVDEAMVALNFVRSLKARFLFLSTNVAQIRLSGQIFGMFLKMLVTWWSNMCRVP